MRKLFPLLMAWSLCPAVVSGHDLKFSSPIDPRDITEDCFDYKDWVAVRGGFHLGDDYCTEHGAAVLAAGFGTVVAVYAPADTHGLGNTIILQHTLDRPIDKEDDTRDNFVYTLYAHLNSIGVRKGQRVYAGETIGAVGKTGASFGIDHLHFEVKTANTLAIPDPSVYTDYGYHREDPDLIGFIDPTRLFDNPEWKTIHIDEEPAQSGRARVEGGEFQFQGQIKIQAPDPDSGAPLLYSPESVEWVDSRISFDLFRGSVDRESLSGSILVDLQPLNKEPIRELGYPFGDVPAGQWYALQVMDGWRREIFGGIREGGVFAPGETTNFAQLFKTLVKSAGRSPSPCVAGDRPLPSSAEISFPEYDAETMTPWFCGYYKSALEAGWLSFFFSFDSQRGAPDQAPQRKEVAALLARIGNMQEIVQESGFSDVPQTHSYMPYIGRCRARGIFRGTEGRLFMPDEKINRAELAVVIEKTFYPRSGS